MPAKQTIPMDPDSEADLSADMGATCPICLKPMTNPAAIKTCVHW